MVTAREIREKLASFLANGIDLDAFEDWIAQNTWNIHLSDDLDAQHLAFSLELRLSEHSAGHLPDPKMREEFSNLLSSSHSIQVQSVFVVESQSSNRSAPAPVVAFQWQYADTKGEEVSA